MKNFALIALAFVFTLGFTACEEKDAGENGDGTVNTDGATDPAANGTPANNVTPTPDPATPNHPVTSVEWMEESHNFGEIKQGEKVRHEFKFKNTGDQPAYIENVKPACGCTAPTWTKEPIAPGAEGTVVLEFDSANKTGVQKKTATVTMNTEPKVKVLNFSAEISE